MVAGCPLPHFGLDSKSVFTSDDLSLVLNPGALVESSTRQENIFGVALVRRKRVNFYLGTSTV